jgi:hypothetical protein
MDTQSMAIVLLAFFFFSSPRKHKFIGVLYKIRSPRSDAPIYPPRACLRAPSHVCSKHGRRARTIDPVRICAPLCTSNRMPLNVRVRHSRDPGYVPRNNGRLIGDRAKGLNARPWRARREPKQTGHTRFSDIVRTQSRLLRFGVHVRTGFGIRLRPPIVN